MPFFVYILFDKNKDSYYIGQTNNLNRRISQHQKKQAKFTKRGNWELVYQEEHNSRSAAVKREKYLKSLKSKKYIAQVLAKD
ncbi:GIY-YIG nuclease family protein [Candidatus Beckwithbacteria bacterium]|nr:GIY-YIG nuclease family protein [Candidatus Beckwithbacteria bacterium]